MSQRQARFLEPWVSVGEHSENLESQLRKEVVPGHPLYGLKVRALAQRVDDDDVLFKVDSPRFKYAVVHLTWSGAAERDPRWPAAQLFAALSNWVEETMLPDHRRFSMERLTNHLAGQDIPLAGGVSDEQLAAFESEHGVSLPEDLKAFFRVMNGSAGVYAEGMLRFWRLDEIESLAEVIGKASPDAAVIQTTYPRDLAGADELYVFADYLYDMQLYAIRLPRKPSGDNSIVLLDGADPRTVARTFSEFVALYIDSPEQLGLD